MANFKGGFAFNNEAAKVEVEQAPDGTLISCVNPVTGEELGGGGVGEVAYEGEMPITKDTNLWNYINTDGDAFIVYLKGLKIANHLMNATSNAKYIFSVDTSVNIGSPMLVTASDSMGDYEYNAYINFDPGNSRTVIEVYQSAATLAATITKIIKIA